MVEWRMGWHVQDHSSEIKGLGLMKCQPKPGHSLEKKMKCTTKWKRKKLMWGFHTSKKKYQNFWSISMKENFFFSKECEVNNLGPLGHMISLAKECPLIKWIILPRGWPLSNMVVLGLALKVPAEQWRTFSSHNYTRWPKLNHPYP